VRASKDLGVRPVFSDSRATPDNPAASVDRVTPELQADAASPVCQSLPLVYHIFQILVLIYRFFKHKNKLPVIFTSFSENFLFHNHDIRNRDNLYLVGCQTYMV